jgi:hypothetical protein
VPSVTVITKIKEDGTEYGRDEGPREEEQRDDADRVHGIAIRPCGASNTAIPAEFLAFNGILNIIISHTIVLIEFIFKIWASWLIFSDSLFES